jgi:uncharacterized membrane protein YsdA (DUF1294 family)
MDIPTLIASAYAVASIICLWLYGLDKRRAIGGGRRVPERTLHTLELLGGWPGAIAGQAIFRHKRRKRSYMLVFWLIVALHAAAWLALVATGRLS